MDYIPNKYDLDGSFGIGYTSRGDIFYFDKEDFDKIKKFSWNYSNEGYVQGVVNVNGKRKYVKQHRFILDAPSGYLTDHINRVRYDNRKSNLRLVTDKENSINITRRKDNTSGFTGVYYHKRDNLWIASISIDGKQLELLRTPSKELAIRARLKGELEYYGEYSPNYNRLERIRKEGE